MNEIALQQQHARILAQPAGIGIPEGGLDLADVRRADQQHTKSALADAATHREGQLATQQHLVEGKRAAVIAAGDGQLCVEGLGIDAETSKA